MKFWGMEVRPGQTVSSVVDNEHYIHISQVALGKTEKVSEKVVVSVKVDDTKVVIGTLSAENHPHFLCDLVFDKEFKLSHSSKTAVVFLSGYKGTVPDPFESSSDEEEDAEEPKKLTAVSLVSEKSKAKSTGNDDKREKDEDESDDSDDDDMSEDEFSSEEDMPTSEEEDSSSEENMDSSEDNESDEEDEVVPKPDNGKKRVAETTLKKPDSNKKGKIATPSDQKTGDKKYIHVATPHPGKQQTSKTANSKSKEKSPKNSLAAAASRAAGHFTAIQRS